MGTHTSDAVELFYIESIYGFPAVQTDAPPPIISGFRDLGMEFLVVVVNPHTFSKPRKKKKKLLVAGNQASK